MTVEQAISPRVTWCAATTKCCIIAGIGIAAAVQAGPAPGVQTLVLGFARWRWLYPLVVSALVAAAAIRIVSTYSVFNQTYDEPISIACGMEWLEHGTYRYDVKHPPLGRIAAALPSYLAGARLTGLDPAAGVPAENADFIGQGNALLNRGGAYWRNLALARAAVLPFFLLACGVVWAWTRWAAGRAAALAALALFIMIPAVLGHAGLAMTDVPLMATLAAALFALCLWLERPSLARSVAFGACAGLAILCKLTALLFLPFCGAPIAVAWLLHNTSAGGWRRRIQTAAVAACTASLLVWAGYRFSWQSYELAAGVAGRQHIEIDQAMGSRGVLHEAVLAAMRAPGPAPELLVGMRQLLRHNTNADYNYFLGQISNRGWKYYYPVVIAVKTPVPLLIFAAVGAIMVFGATWRSWTLLLPIAGILAAGLLSHENVGVRHVLTIYVMMAALAATGVAGLMRQSIAWRACAAALLVWMGVSSAAAHPDYLAWFNEFADGRSGNFGVESDLDYGQDLARLGSECARLRVPALALKYHGTAPADLFHLPPWHILKPGIPETGWIAISMNKLRLGEPDKRDAYRWLDRIAPVETVGASIRLYFIPPVAPPPGHAG